MSIGHSLETAYLTEDERKQVDLQRKIMEKDLGVTITNYLKSATQCKKQQIKPDQLLE